MIHIVLNWITGNPESYENLNQQRFSVLVQNFQYWFMCFYFNKIFRKFRSKLLTVFWELFSNILE